MGQGPQPIPSSNADRSDTPSRLALVRSAPRKAAWSNFASCRSASKIRLTQPGFPQGGACQSGSLKKGAAQIRVVEISCRKVAAIQKRPAQIRAPEGASDEIGVLEIRLLVAGPISGKPDTMLFEQVWQALLRDRSKLGHDNFPE